MELCCYCSQPTQDLRFMKCNGDLKEPLSFDSKDLTHEPLTLKTWKNWCTIDFKDSKYPMTLEFGNLMEMDERIIESLEGVVDCWPTCTQCDSNTQKLKQLLGHGNGHLPWPICGVDFKNNMMHLAFKAWITLLQLWATTIKYILVLWYTQCMLLICYIVSLQQRLQPMNLIRINIMIYPT